MIGFGKQDNRPKKRSWAPGNYLGTCAHCESEFTGDKRARECADCAYSTTEEEDTLQALVNALDILTNKVSQVEDEWNEAYNNVIAVVGSCPLCKNHHYPHCNSK